MGIIKDVFDFVNGNCLHVRDLAMTYDTTEDDIRERFETLEEKGILRKITRNSYGVSEDLEDAEELILSFNNEFEDLQEKIDEEYPKVDITTYI